jgi:trans-aconitate methyltransferase
MLAKRNEWDIELYNNKHGFIYEYGKDLIKQLNPQEDELILDLGCGTGRLANEISKSGATVIGIDASEKMINAAREKFSEIDFFVKDTANFQFKEPFDAIFSNAALHWVLESEKAIICMHNNLKKRGRLVLEFGGKGNVKIIINAVDKVLLESGYPERAKIKKWYFPSISEYTTLLERNGFEVELAELYEKPTELTDSENGIKEWLMMFGAILFKDLSTEVRNQIIEKVQNEVKDRCFINGKWFADYMRIRIIATKC